MNLAIRASAWVLASLSTITFSAELAYPEARVAHGSRLATKKDMAAPAAEGDDDDRSAPVATLDQVHTGEHTLLDATSPTLERFEQLLADRVTGAHHAIDARLLALLRALAATHPGSRIEIVSGFRSPKLNEMLRKKGHHVSSHSQHSLGHACDFRIVPSEAERALDPRVVEREIRGMGWDGGLGVYPTKDDCFVHADVGARRSWTN